jgi:hypothetical protein
VLWEDLKKDMPPSLKISPVAAVPQTNRRARIILDLSFPVHQPEKAGRRRKMGPVIAPSVNETTVKLSPQTAVKEIGHVLTRVLHFMSSTPADQQIYFSKVDLSDGFWRMIVQPSQRWNFCYVMPDPPGSPIRIVIPSALQMGWTESPAYFCTATETGRDIIQWLIEAKVELPMHPFEKFMIPDPLPPGHGDGDSEVHVYVDDYILAVVQDEDQVLLRRVARATLHGIHAIFPPPGESGHVGGKDPISEKKLAKGDAMMALIKEILGFMLNEGPRTVWLPDLKRDAIITEIRRLIEALSVSHWQATQCYQDRPVHQSVADSFLPGHTERSQAGRHWPTQRAPTGPTRPPGAHHGSLRTPHPCERNCSPPADRRWLL